MIDIVSAADPQHIMDAQSLFREYGAEWGGADLAAENFEDEVLNLGSKYSPPHGCLFLALKDRRAVGCVALRVEPSFCEMKRLFVNPRFRGFGIGRALVAQAIMEARHLGYHRILLDTLETMNSAVQLYEAFGFRRTAPYNAKSGHLVVFMELLL